MIHGFPVRQTGCSGGMAIRLWSWVTPSTEPGSKAAWAGVSPMPGFAPSRLHRARRCEPVDRYRTHNVLHRIPQVRIVGGVAMAVAPGLQVGRLQPSVGGGLGDAGVLGQGADAPRGGSGWWLQWGVGRLGHPLAMMGGARALFVLRSCPALVEEATAPVAHRLAQPHPWGSPDGWPALFLAYLLPGGYNSHRLTELHQVTLHVHQCLVQDLGGIFSAAQWHGPTRESLEMNGMPIARDGARSAGQGAASVKTPQHSSL